MDILDLINTRRSIREFTDEPLTDGEIQDLLQAGFQAPTGYNHQPMEFIVLKDEDIIDQIVELHPNAKMLAEARQGIMVCGNRELEESEGFLIEDCSAAIQNILLAAHGMGLGAVWVSVHGNDRVEDGMREVFQVPDHVMAIGLVVVGNTEKEGYFADRYDEDRVYIDTWGNK